MVSRSPLGMAWVFASNGDYISVPTGAPRSLISMRLEAEVLTGARLRLTQVPPCWGASVCMRIGETYLSPFRLALLVKLPRTLSCYCRINHFLEVASVNFLNCQDAEPMYVGAPKRMNCVWSSRSQAAPGMLPSLSILINEARAPSVAACATRLVWPYPEK